MTDDLDQLADTTAQRARMRADAIYADEKWRGLVVAALEAGRPVSQIAKAAGISRARVYQIRDGQ